MDVLLVIDMLNDFILPDGKLYCGSTAEKIVPLVIEKINQFRTEGNPVLFVADSHEKEDKEFAMFPPHCIKGTRGAQVLGALWQEGEPIIHKTRYSAFYNTNLDALLRSYQDEGELIVHVVGVCTNICVQYTVEELRNRDLKTLVYKDLVASFDTAAHEFALSQMGTVLGAELI